MTVNLIQLKPEHVASWGEKINSHVSNIAEHSRGKYNTEDFFSCAFLGKVQFWLGLEELNVKAFGVTQVNDFPSSRVCQFVGLTGEDRKEWISWMQEIEKWAKFNGCTDMELVCRPGWERVMKDQNFKKTHVVLNKYL